MKQYYVEVVEYGTSTIVKRLGPKPERATGKLQDGVEINLDHDNYFTRIVEAKK